MTSKQEVFGAQAWFRIGGLLADTRGVCVAKVLVPSWLDITRFDARYGFVVEHDDSVEDNAVAYDDTGAAVSRIDLVEAEARVVVIFDDSGGVELL